MWIAKAIEKVGGKVEDRESFLDAVLKTELTDSPLGRPVRLDSYGNPVYDVYIRKVVKNKDGKYWNVPIATYEKVSQFWTYDPETYLKQPPYSRDFQGIKKS
jgi:branched-chain amino acid transport system substrate-binding protein